MKNFLESYLHHGGDEFDWAVAYDARDIKIILLDALMPIAQHFEDLDKRRDWFLALVNSHLSPPSPSGKDEVSWEMDASGFNAIIKALLHRLDRQLADANSALSFKKEIRRYCRRQCTICPWTTKINVMPLR